MEAIDYIIVAVYAVGITALGWWAGRSERLQSASDFFLGGSDFPWWLVGTSMIATAFAADTPLAVAGLTLDKGVAGNWLWWSFACGNVLVAVALAPLWRRTQVVTDAELCELRYQGPAAALLRGLKAFYSAVPLNCIIMGWVFLAMDKIASQLLPGVSSVAVLAVLMGLTLLYSVRAGFRAVILTDLVQFPIALVGAVVLVFLSVDAAGGLDAVVAATVERAGPDAIKALPVGTDSLPWDAFVAFLGVQWWAQRSADGGGIFVQRMLSARSERDAAFGGLWFCVVHYCIRPWPWILTGMAAVIVVPEVVAADSEAAYAAMMIEVLPAGLRGLLVASFLAAFMSTIDTHLNWGASYVVNDLVGRFGNLPDRTVTTASRVAVVAIAACAILATLWMDSLAGAWKFLIAFGSGTGAVLLARWYWWRITAAAEIAAMVASTVLSIAIYAWAPDTTHLTKLLVIIFGSAAVWFPITLRTSPDPAALAVFYRRVRPPGPGWAAVARACGEPPPAPLWPSLLRWALALTGVLAGLLGTGAALLEGSLVGAASAAAGFGLLVLIVRTMPARSL